MRRVQAVSTAAFADGRRQREAARMRQHQFRMQQHQAQRSRTRHGFDHRRVPPALWIFGIPVVAIGAVATVMFAALVVGVLVTLVLTTGATGLVVGTGAFVLVRRHKRRTALRRGGAAGTVPLPARPAARPRPDLVWAHARNRFHVLRAEFAAYECDAMQVLRLPALADVSVPSTARFVDAFAEAQALETDAFPPESHAAGFVAAVDRAERAWRAAREAAERIRLSGLTPEERGTVERVIKILTTARRSGSDAERLAAYSRARSELAKLERAGVLHLPQPAQSALDAAAQPALPA